MNQLKSLNLRVDSNNKLRLIDEDLENTSADTASIIKRLLTGEYEYG